MLYYVSLQVQVTNIKHNNIYICNTLYYIWCNLTYNSLKRHRLEMRSNYRFQIWHDSCWCIYKASITWDSDIMGGLFLPVFLSHFAVLTVSILTEKKRKTARYLGDGNVAMSASGSTAPHPQSSIAGNYSCAMNWSKVHCLMFKLGLQKCEYS